MTPLLAAVAVILSVVTPPFVVASAADLDSEWVTETDFVTVSPGRSATFQVFFRNTGTRTWIKGTDTQIDLAACLDDKITCDREPTNRRFDPGTWLSRTRYAAQSQASVPPGGIAAFRYEVVVPGDQPPGTYRFYGALVRRTTGVAIHPDGYFHELTVPAAGCAPGTVVLAPSFRQRQVGFPFEQTAVVTCTDGKPATDVHVTFTVQPSAIDTRSSNLERTAITDRNGIATVTWSRTDPGTDTVSAYVTSRPVVRGGAIARWTVALRVLECLPTLPVRQANDTTRTFDLTAWDQATGSALSSSILNVGVRTFIPTGAATVNGASVARLNVGATGVRVTTDTAGKVRIVLVGADATVELRVFIDANANGVLEDTEFREDCASTSFAPG